jgi:hypothetical protein
MTQLVELNLGPEIKISKLVFERELLFYMKLKMIKSTGFGDEMTVSGPKFQVIIGD